MTDRLDTRDRSLISAGTRYRLAIGLAVIGIALSYLAFRVQTIPYLTSTPAASRPQRYLRMWFDTNDRLVGAFWQGRRLILERADSNPPRQWRFDVGDSSNELLWTVSSDVSRIAWISGSTLHVARLADEAKPFSIPLAQKALALCVLSDDSAAVLYNDATIHRWDASGKSLGDWRVPVASVDRVAADGNDLAVYTSRDDKLTLFSFHQGRWVQASSVLAPELPDQIVFPAPGVVATLTGGRLRLDGHVRPGPSGIGSVSLHLYDAIVTGSFDSVFVLPRDDDAYVLAAAPPDSVISAGQKQLAVSGANGTALFDLIVGSHLTSSGRKNSWFALGCFVLALILALGPALIDAFLLGFRTITRKDPRRVHVKSSIDKVPPELVELIHSSDAILWAGAGLSAQAGFPTREDFIATMLRTAQVEKWIEGPLLPKLIGMCSRGKAEDALNELVAAMSSQRGALLSHFTATYSRFAAPSRSHELLERLNFGYAVTTNYDILLERQVDSWANGITTLKSNKLAPRGLMKLFGALQSLSTVIPCQAELRDSMAKSPCIVGFRELFKEKPVLFIGCSAHGLLADLNALAIPGNTTRRRYAVIGVGGSSWQRDVDELARKYGIEVLLYAEQDIGHGLPAFLDRLVRDVEKLHRDTTTQAAAAS